MIEYHENQGKINLGSYKHWVMRTHKDDVGRFDSIPFANDTIGAYVNHSRWIVRCPLCNAPQNLSNTMIFMCVLCKPIRYMVRVQDMESLNTLLSLIPEKKRRNWNGSSLEDLIKEVQHGTNNNAN